jgi:hypothetical protein
MSKVYDSVVRAQRERDSNYAQSGGLRDRLRGWLPRRRSAASAAYTAPPPVVEQVEIDLDAMSSPDELAAALQEKLASIQVAVDVMDTRISAEIVEREAKILEEIGRGMRGIEAELLHRIAAMENEMKRTIRLSTAVVLSVGVLLTGITIGVLLNF